MKREDGPMTPTRPNDPAVNEAAERLRAWFDNPRLTAEIAAAGFSGPHSMLAAALATERGSLDVVRLAAALDNVDRTYEQGWTPAHYARAIAAEYSRLHSEKGRGS